ncbi:hypothetical protein Cgig2_010319 [Carnegiea gigantea]|uniref:Uncharacterized protein n=1 Tax=Carnegiea gigantea TaxID=171969 RepID=A0A9Q1JK38_9CARY|nr:hypothetical protein Cgig2_010319 [Carnegiea gigantea]
MKHQKSTKRPEHKAKPLQKSPTKLVNKMKGENAKQPKKHMSKENPVNDRQSEMMRRLSQVEVPKGHVFDVEPSNSSHSEENDLTYECKEADHKNAKVVRSTGFTSFLKVDLKQIPGKFSKWLVESFEPYAVCFRHPDGPKFPITAFDVEIIKITKYSMDEQYDEVHVAWLKEWKVQHNAPELTRMLEFILAKNDGTESFKRNFIIYLVNYFFSTLTNDYCSKFILKYVKDVSQIASLDWCRFKMDKLTTSVRH